MAVPHHHRIYQANEYDGNAKGIWKADFSHIHAIDFMPLIFCFENIPLKRHSETKCDYTQTIIIDEWHFSTIRATRETKQKKIVNIVSTSSRNKNKSTGGGGADDCSRRMRLPQTNLSSFRLFWLRDTPKMTTSVSCLAILIPFCMCLHIVLNVCFFCCPFSILLNSVRNAKLITPHTPATCLNCFSVRSFVRYGIFFLLLTNGHMKCVFRIQRNYQLAWICVMQYTICRNVKFDCILLKISEKWQVNKLQGALHKGTATRGIRTQHTQKHIRQFFFWHVTCKNSTYWATFWAATIIAI